LAAAKGQKKGKTRGRKNLRLRYPAVAMLSNTPFLVAYRIEKNEVRILAVLHAGREWPEEFE
jgi:plasmid stabilization system protein ParE